MLRVHICEDNTLQREEFKKLVMNIIELQKLDMEIGLVLCQPDEMIQQIKEEKINGVFFLDIDLQNTMTGLELAKTIREYQPRCYIVFVTTHSEMLQMTFSYKVEAMDYIIKDNYRDLENRICQCLMYAQELETQSSCMGKIRKFSIKLGSKIQEIAYDEIIFFEANSISHKLILHTKNSIIEFAGRLKEVETMLDKDFCRCHKSYIINKKMIKKIDEKENMVWLVGGEACPMSVRLGKILKNSL